MQQANQEKMQEDSFSSPLENKITFLSLLPGISHAPYLEVNTEEPSEFSL